jgi:hypothetical protein
MKESCAHLYTCNHMTLRIWARFWNLGQPQFWGLLQTMFPNFSHLQSGDISKDWLWPSHLLIVGARQCCGHCNNPAWDQNQFWRDCAYLETVYTSGSFGRSGVIKILSSGSSFPTSHGWPTGSGMKVGVLQHSEVTREHEALGKRGSLRLAV